GWMLWGLGRTIANEHPELRASRADVSGEASQEEDEEQEIAALANEIASGGREEEVALRGGRRYVGRLVRRGPEAGRGEGPAPGGGEPVRLEIDEPGVLDRLVVRRAARTPPASGEVEIEVAVAGLNFRDVLQALGAIPDPDRREGSGPTLGFECAGRV